MTRRSWAFLLIASFVFLASVAPFVTDAQISGIDNLSPGEWYQIPSSKLNQSGVFPPPGVPLGNGPDFFFQWSGGAYDTKRDRLIIWGGGHADYGGDRP